jgi:hypothetical protein
MKQSNNESISELREDFFIWHKSKSESFLWINKRSRVPSRWLSYPEGIKGKDNDIIKPINLYVDRLYPKPKLISIDNNVVTLQQTNHAEIFLVNSPEIINTMERDEPYKERIMWNLDRPWIRQYYLSDKKDFGDSATCFNQTFRFYVPWIIDEDISVDIRQPESSPFLISEDTISFKKILNNTQHVDPPFVHFQFKKIGSHMIDQEYGKISRFSPMYNMVFEASDIMVKEIRRFYE